jgi:hypothetical protein
MRGVSRGQDRDVCVGGMVACCASQVMAGVRHATCQNPHPPVWFEKITEVPAVAFPPPTRLRRSRNKQFSYNIVKFEPKPTSSMM